LIRQFTFVETAPQRTQLIIAGARHEHPKNYSAGSRASNAASNAANSSSDDDHR
jgi:hypothetical protein